MVLDRQKVLTDDAKPLSLRLRRGIITFYKVRKKHYPAHHPAMMIDHHFNKTLNEKVEENEKM